jgi:hypothetical protein
MMTNSIDRDQWLNVTSESRDRIEPFFLNFALGRNRTFDPRIPEPKRTPLGYIIIKLIKLKKIQFEEKNVLLKSFIHWSRRIENC